jgi:hypothetical protein
MEIYGCDSVIMHDLLKPSIQLEEDVPTPVLGIRPGEDSLTPTPGAPSGKNGTALASEADLGTSARPVGQAREPGGEIATIIRPPSPDVDWRRPISEYFGLGQYQMTKLRPSA